MADDTSRLLCALAYLLWPVALVLVIIEESKAKNEKKNNEFRHHGYNALGFAVAVLIIWVIAMFFFWIPVVGMIIWWVLWIGIVVLAIMYAVRAYKGQEIDIPLVTGLLRKNVKGF